MVINKFLEYIKSVFLEMKKVSWPTKNEILNSTVIVILISVFVALIIFVLDRIFTGLLGLVIR
uniref:Protein translocase subunit SecE n=1 Tax=candidate division WOR-3 bacterium TaxID=2052148 RepID=A0A7V3RHM4_UNCW3